MQNLWPSGACEWFTRPEAFWGAFLCGLLQVAPRDHTSPFAGTALLLELVLLWLSERLFLGKWAILLQSSDRVLGSSASPGGRAGS